MCLLERVLEHGPGETICAVDPARSRLFAAPDGSVPAWVGLEYMAQCVAAHGGLLAHAHGEPLRPGVLLGSRRVRLFVERFAAERELRVRARHHRGESGLVAFDCEVREDGGAAVLVEARLAIYLLERWEALEAQLADAR